MSILEHLLTTESLISLLTLTMLEVVLGIDNIVFISILASKLPKDQQSRARNIGLVIAVIPRVALLFAIAWIVSLKATIFSLFGSDFSGRDIILLVGGLFLLYKSTTEIHQKLEGEEEHLNKPKKSPFTMVIFQIVLLNIVFSFDSILTAVGLVDPDVEGNLYIMILAVIFSMLLMIAFAKGVSNFVNKHPTVKVLALSFLLMIGLLLVVEAFDVHVPKGYVYFAMAFSLFVEILNLRMNKKGKPVHLRDKYKEEDEIINKMKD